MHDGLLLNKSNSTTDKCPSIFQLYRGGQFYWWKNPECPVKTTDLSQITGKRYQILSNVVSSTSYHEQNSNSHL